MNALYTVGALVSSLAPKAKARLLDKDKADIHALVIASQRVGDTPEARIRWLLDFLQKDLTHVTPGDLANLSDEVAAFGSPLRTGYVVFNRPEVPIKVNTLKRLQGELRALLEECLAGKPITTIPLRLKLIGTARPPGSVFDLAWVGEPVHLALFRMMEDLSRLDLRRVRQCVRGTHQNDSQLGITTCGRWFYAKDFRQRFCSSACGKEVRWRHWWDAKRDTINKRRRKGG